MSVLGDIYYEIFILCFCIITNDKQYLCYSLQPYGSSNNQQNLNSNQSRSYQYIGNTTYGSNSSTYQRIGNITYGSDGSTYQRIGNITYGSDGSNAQRIGNTTYVTDANGSSVSCQNIRNITYCN